MRGRKANITEIRGRVYPEPARPEAVVGGIDHSSLAVPLPLICRIICGSDQ